jgi:transposase
MKEQFRTFWECFSRVTAVGFFERWYEWASKSKLTPMVAKAAMLKRHLTGLLNYFKHRMTNAMSEGFNSKIQQIESNARGFRSFQSYRVRILFFCGKLDLLPRKVSHYNSRRT